MSCNEPITPLSTSGSGALQALSCCPSPPAQEQELFRKWKQTRKGLFSTVPVPYGSASFRTGAYAEIAGPTKPGDTAVIVTGPVIVVGPPVGNASVRDGMPANESQN